MLSDPQWRFEPSLIDLARWADFLVVACAGGPGTHHLVSHAVLRALGPRAFLVNIARGSVVDKKALVETLQSGQLDGAALDVFEMEPTVPQELLSMDNVVVLLHIGSGTVETRQAMVDLVLRNIRGFVEYGQLQTEVA